MGMLLERMSLPLKCGRLPSEYQEVKYIESTGTQYIKTGIECPSVYTDVVLQFTNNTAFPSIALGTWNYGWRYVVARAEASKLSYDIRDTQGATYQNGFDTNIHNIQFYTNGNHMIKFDGKTAGAFYGNIDLTSLAEIYLFSGHGANGAEYYSSVRIYSCKLVKDNVVIRDFVPCCVKATGECGMYDLVSKTFFGNNGTGNFLKGENV